MLKRTFFKAWYWFSDMLFSHITEELVPDLILDRFVIFSLEWDSKAVLGKIGK